MIKVGVSCCFIYPDKSRDYFAPKTLCYLENDMARFLASEDVMPVLVPDLEDRDLFKICGAMDGFVFQGGADISPESYGEKPLYPDKWQGDRHRDLYELKIMDFAIKSGKPVFGICRGFQLMNVYFGGTLYQDIDEQGPGQVIHKNKELYDQWIHTIEFSEDGFLDGIYSPGTDRKVNSIHHQGIKTLARDLEVAATCKEDGMIEAFYWSGSEPGKVMGVQWHPEFSHNFDGGLIDAKILYRHFLSFCRSS